MARAHEHSRARVLADPVALTRALVDIESVSGDEDEIADAVEAALRARGRTCRSTGSATPWSPGPSLGRAQRVVLAGHLDTVPLADNFPSTVDGDVMCGCGTSDMKSGIALALHLAVTAPEPRYDVTYLFYDCEEVESARNGLNRLAQSHPDWLPRPTSRSCSSRRTAWSRPAARARCGRRYGTGGRRAHAARSWHGVNAIHAAGEVLQRLSGVRGRTGHHRRLRRTGRA